MSAPIAAPEAGPVRRTASAPIKQRQRLAAVLGGAALGFTLSRVGFTNYTAVHDMFTFSDPRLLLVFVVGVALTFVGLQFVPAVKHLPRRRFESGIVIGSIMFGLGWALTGACPGVMFAQLGEGQLSAVVALAGAVVGTQLMRRIQPKFFSRDTGSCG